MIRRNFERLRLRLKLNKKKFVIVNQEDRSRVFFAIYYYISKLQSGCIKKYTEAIHEFLGQIYLINDEL